MLKKVLAITLAVFMIICVLSVTAFAEGEGGEPETPVTEIYTIEDLYMINYNLDGNFILMNDIDMTEATAEGGDWDYGGRGWEPIGSNGIYSGNTPFTGTFDGNGYKITGMRINISSLPSGTGFVYAGLFAKNTGTIKNLSMFGSIESKYGGYYGSIAGYNTGTILSCVNNMSITCSSGDYAGGITGYNTGTILSCVNNMNMSITCSSFGYAGGIAGDNSGTILSCVNNMSITITCSSSDYIYAGGIAGSNSGTILSCVNNMSIACSSDSDIYAGGIAGITYKGTVSECCNNGDISAKYTGSSGYNVYSSGITLCSGGTVTDCYNTGSITAANSYSSDRACSAGISAEYNFSSSPTISNCYNIGTAAKAISYQSVTNCYFLNGSGADTAGAKSLTAAQMKIQGVYGGFDFDNVWFIDSNGEYPYPQLRNNPANPPEEPVVPTDEPTEAPTDEPTDAPTEAPSQAPVIIILGDVDGDLDAGIIDATYIQRYNAGFNTPFAIGEPIEFG